MSEDDDFETETFKNGGRPDDLFGDSNPINDQSESDKGYPKSKSDYNWYNFSIPWDLRMAYTLRMQILLDKMKYLLNLLC